MAALPVADGSSSLVQKQHGRKLQLVDKVVQECKGYRMSPLPRFCVGLYWIFLSVLGRVCAEAATHLLTGCPLQQAQYVLVKLIDGRQWLLKVDILKAASAHRQRSEEVRAFKLFLTQYTYSPSVDAFLPTPGMPLHMPRRICDALRALRHINKGGSWDKLNPEHTRTHRAHMVRLYGNDKKLPQKSILHALMTSCLPPSVFCIQYVELAYLAYKGYWVYSVIFGLLAVVALSAIVSAKMKQHRSLAGLVKQQGIVPIVQGGWVRAIPSYRLVPGDIIVLQQGRPTCDMVLLQGSCLVSEAMISGEAKQVRKASYVPEAGGDYHPDAQPSCTVYAGTLVQQVWNAEDAKDDVLAMVVCTGINSTLGTLVKQFISPTQRPGQDPFIHDCFRLYIRSFFIQLLIFIAYALNIPRFKPSANAISKRVLDIGLHAAPVGVPVIMVFCSIAAREWLKPKSIEELRPGTFKIVGETEVVAFDKTGTLTGSLARLHGMLPVTNGVFEPLQSNAVRWSNNLAQAAAVCHGLTMINKSTIVGDDAERRLFQTVEARFLDRESVALPRKPDQHSGSRQAELHILRVLEFNPENLKCGAVALSNDAPLGAALFFVKGPPLVIKELVQPSTVPHDFDEVVQDWNSKSFRVTAFAVGVMPHVHTLDLSLMSFQDIESYAQSLELLSVQVLTNHVRPDSKATVSLLQERGAIRTVMITGDYPRASLSVAKNVGMLHSPAQVVVIDILEQPKQTKGNGPLAAHSAMPLASSRGSLRPIKPPGADPQGPTTDAISPPAAHREPLSMLTFVMSISGQALPAAEALNGLAEGQLQCALTGDAFKHMLRQCDLSVLETVMRNTVVFARMKPHQKGQVMDLLGSRGLHQVNHGQWCHIQGLGHRTMFCGLGIVNFAALTAADVGFAVGSNEAIVAAQIMTRNTSIAGVADLIRVGKSMGCLVTSLLKYQVLYQLTLSVADTVAFCLDGSTFSIIQLGGFDGVVMTLAAVTAMVPPLEQLTPKKPEPISTDISARARLGVMATILLIRTQ
ncbi:hypothetical protein WJX82_000871 [Trebouxia sp. C0006]